LIDLPLLAQLKKPFRDACEWIINTLMRRQKPS
jgi:hypothetical protein